MPRNYKQVPEHLDPNEEPIADHYWYRHDSSTTCPCYPYDQVIYTLFAIPGRHQAVAHEVPWSPSVLKWTYALRDNRQHAYLLGGGPEGFRPNNGQVPDVSNDIIVDIRRRNGEMALDFPNTFDWTVHDSPRDIIRYSVTRHTRASWSPGLAARYAELRGQT